MDESCILETLKEQKDKNKSRIHELTQRVEELEMEIADLEEEKEDMEFQLETLGEEYEILEDENYTLVRDAEIGKRYSNFIQWLDKSNRTKKVMFDRLYEEYSRSLLVN